MRNFLCLRRLCSRLLAGSRRAGGPNARATLAAASVLLLAVSVGAGAAQADVFGATQDVAGTADLSAVACYSADDCVAVGQNAAGTAGAVVPVTDGSAGTEHDVSGSTQPTLTDAACVFGSVDCFALDSASSLVGDGGGAALVPISDGVPAATDGPVPGIDLLAGIACPPSSSACLAVGQAGSGVDTTGEFAAVGNGAPGPAVSVPGTERLTLVACSAVGECDVIGQDPSGAYVEAAVADGALVGAPQSLGLPSGGSPSPTALACTTSGRCFVAGYSNTGAFEVPITSSGPGTVVDIPSLAQASGIACPTGSAFCVIAGEDAASDESGAIVLITVADGTIGAEQVDNDPESQSSNNGFTGIGCSTATACVGTLQVFSFATDANTGSVAPIALPSPVVPPTATITAPAPGATYATGSAPTFDFSCSPAAGQTISSCAGTVDSGPDAGPVSSGATINTSQTGTFTLTVTATDADGGVAATTSGYTVVAAAQTITFAQFDNGNDHFAFAHAPVPLTATASSNLPVSYAVTNGGPCTVDTSTPGTPKLTFTGAGSCVVEASQAGDSGFAAATPVDKTVVINPPAPPSCADGTASAPNSTATLVRLGCADDPSVPGQPLTISIVSGPSHGKLSSPTSGPSGGTVTYTPDAGYDGQDSFTFQATNSQGTSNVATESLTVAPPADPPSVTITAPVAGGSYAIGDPTLYDFTCHPGNNGTLLTGVNGCGGAIGGQVVLSDSTQIGTLTDGTGLLTLTVTATDTDGKSTTLTRTFTVGSSQTVMFPQLGPYPFGHAPVELGATASSGLPVTYSIVSGQCTVDSATSLLTFAGSGLCVVAADQAGGPTSKGTFLAAPTVDSTIVVNPPTPPSCSDQTLSFPFGAVDTITLVCSDAAGDAADPLAVATVAAPANGTLSTVDATGAVTYTPAAGFSGADSFTFHATNQQGTSNTATVSINVAAEVPPASVSVPGVSGSPVVGQTLTCSNGVWSGGTPQTFTYQWVSDGNPISGATAATYLVAPADQGHTLACAVTATNSGGRASATSAGIAIPPAPVTTGPPPVVPPASAGAPAISGTTKLGSSLSCSTGAWSGTMPQTYAYQWERNGVAIAGATGATFAISTSDLGYNLACAVVASNSAGSATAQSGALAVPFPSNAFSFASKPKASRTGTISFPVKAPGSGRFAAIATFLEKVAKAKKAGIAKTTKPKTVTYGTASVSAKGAGSFGVTIHATKTAASALKKLGRLAVTISVSFTPTGGKPLTRKTSLTVKHS
jgi:hypothetical protein